MARSFTAASSQYIENSTAVLSAYPFTLIAWFYIASSAKTGVIHSIADTGGNNDLIDLLTVSDGTIQYNVRMGGLNAQAQTVATYSTDTWQHAAGVTTASNSHAIYLNGGNKQTSSTDAGTFSSLLDVTTIGLLNRLTPAAYFDGYIAEAAIYDTDLTDAEIAVLSTGASPLMVRPQSLVTYWPLIGRTSPEIDIVGGYGMTLNGGPTAAEHAPVYYPVPAFSVTPTAVVDVAASINVSPSANYVQIV